MTLLGREKLARAVAAGGLRLQWHDGQTETAHPHVVTELSALDDVSSFALALVTVKSYDTASAMAGLVGQLLPTTHILSLQNGVGNEELLASFFPDVPILAGSITFPATMPQPGVIAIAKDSGVIALAAASSAADVTAVADTFRRAKFSVAVYDDYRNLKWSKLLMNIISNAIPAILDMPPAETLSHSGVFDLEMESIRETLTVMRAAGISPVDVPGYPVRWLMRAVNWLPLSALRIILKPKMIGGRGDKLPSLMLDLRRGRNHSEVTVLNSMVVDLGKRYGIPTPVNQTISAILNGMLDGTVRRKAYYRAPDALLRTVQKTRNTFFAGG